MLTLTRAQGESLQLDNVYDAEGNRISPIIITHMGPNQIGVHADKSIQILRSEILDRIKIEQLNARYRDYVSLADKEE